MKRRKHHLDLLPLLDIFMVVLFVFATIQERKLDDTTQASAELQQENAGLRREKAELEARVAKLVIDANDAEQLRGQQQGSASAEQAARVALTQAVADQAELRAALDQLRAAAEEAAKNGTTSGAEVLRRQEILARLLDHFSVFEVEIEGVDGDGATINRCCYRTEPIDGAWRSCGQMPTTAMDLKDWLADGGAGLLEALRRTRGGNALTIVRQNERAPWQIGRKLEEQLRERFPDHKIYSDRVALHTVACPR